MNTAAVLTVEVIHAGHSYIPVEVLSAQHDALDWAGVVGGIIGGIAGLVGAGAAIVALTFAKRSAADAADSARSAEKDLELAEESLKIMREESQAARAERSRRAHPTVDPSVKAVGTRGDGPPADIVLTLRFKNDGNRPAESVVINVYVPAEMNLATCDENGTPDVPQIGQMIPGSEVGDASLNLWAHDIGTLVPGAITAVYLRVHRPSPGIWALSVLLLNEDLPERTTDRYWMLKVPERGAAVSLIPIEALPEQKSDA
jgi:hypothetical protein